MRMAAWWDDVRTPIAFVVAPLAAPVVIVCYLHLPMSENAAGLVIVISAATAYIITMLFGVPLYFIMRAWNKTEFAFALILGAAAGALVMALVASGFGVSGLLPAGAISGGAVGGVLWLIARPDLPVQGGEGGSNDGTTSP